MSLMRAMRKRKNLFASKQCDENVVALLEGTDQSEALGDTLLQLLKSGPGGYAVASQMMRLGWRSCLEGEQSCTTNRGVVAALVFSVVLSLVCEPVKRIEGDDDTWSDSRENMEKIVAALILLSAILSIATVTMAIVWLNQGSGCIRDADDYLRYCSYNPPAVVDVTLTVGILAIALALPMIAVLVNEDPIASIGFYVGYVVLAVTLGVWLRGLYAMNKMLKDDFDANAEMYTEVMEKHVKRLKAEQKSKGEENSKDEHPAESGAALEQK